MNPKIRKRATEFYEFGPFRLDPVKRLVISNGERLPLTQKAFETLLVLVQNCDRVVDKHELMSAVWPDTIVEENNLTQSISTLRKALGESRKDHRYIVTVQGRGYRFVAGVRRVFDERSELILLGQTRTSILIEEEDGTSITKLAGHFLERLSEKMRLASAAVLIAGILAGFLWWQFRPAEPVKSESPVVTTIPLKNLQYLQNPEAYQAYIKGRHFWNKRTEAGVNKALEYFRQAISLDEGYALAYSGLADSYLMMAVYGYGSHHHDEAIALAKSAALKALELDESLAEAHTSLGACLTANPKDLPAAENQYKRAIELNPSYATARQWYGELLRVTGRSDEALVQLKRAQELEPLSPIMNASLGMSYYYARQYDLVIEQNRKALELDPNFTPAHFGLGLAFEQKGMYEAAIAEFRRAKELSNGGEWMIAALGHAYAKSGDRARALRAFHELKKRGKPASAYTLALIHVAFGEKDKALPLLQKVREEAGEHIKLNLDPRLDPIRSDSAFAEIFKS